MYPSGDGRAVLPTQKKASEKKTKANQIPVGRGNASYRRETHTNFSRKIYRGKVTGYGGFTEIVASSGTLGSAAGCVYVGRCDNA